MTLSKAHTSAKAADVAKIFTKLFLKNAEYHIPSHAEYGGDPHLTITLTLTLI